MFSSRMSGQSASPGMPARWMTASAPRQAAVMASMSVTDAWMAASPGPAVSGAMSSTRSVRPGRASRGRSMDPTRPAAPVMTTTDTPQPFRPGPVTGGYQVTYAPFLSAGPDRGRRASGDGGAGGGGEVGVQGGQALGHRPGGAVADGPAVHVQDRDQAAHGAGHERLLGHVELGQRVVARLAADPGRGGVRDRH